MAENAETIPENANNGEKSESIESAPVVAPAKKPSEPAKSQPIEPDPKKRGRPSGAKDREPRRKKVIIVEEPVSEPKQTAAIPEKPSPPAAPAAPAAPQPVVYEREELSPRTLIREASRRIVNLRGWKQILEGHACMMFTRETCILCRSLSICNRRPVRHSKIITFLSKSTNGRPQPQPQPSQPGNAS